MKGSYGHSMKRGIWNFTKPNKKRVSPGRITVNTGYTVKSNAEHSKSETPTRQTELTRIVSAVLAYILKIGEV